jgi:pimeloyl-ACP methyl ester carboxylesterase
MVIQTPYLNLSAKNWHTDSGLPVLGLHGWLDNANTYDRLAPLLPQLNLISLDLPGHGKSDHRPAGMRYHYSDYLDDVMAVSDKLGWERFIILGHSMGAGIGCLAASAYPDRVAQLILIEGLGAVTGQLKDVPGLLRRSVDAMKSERYTQAQGYDNLEVLIRARAAAGRIERSSAEILMRRSVKRRGNAYYIRSDQRLKRPYLQHYTNEVMLALLRGITSPVLVIAAEDGLLRKRSYYESRCNAIRDLRIVDLPGHHHLHLDNPRPVARAVGRFIEHHKERLNGYKMKPIESKRR